MDFFSWSLIRFADLLFFISFPPRFARALVGMVMHNPDTNEIAKPSELLASVKTYMSVLQTVENYGMFKFLSLFSFPLAEFLFFSFLLLDLFFVLINNIK